MKHIAIIGPNTCFKTKATKELIFKFKGQDYKIISGGNNDGIEKDVKKIALSFELPYMEYNPSYTGHNLYSALNEGYYSKGKHQSHFLHRYLMLLNDPDLEEVYIGYDPSAKDWPIYETIKKKSEKKGIKTAFI